MFPSAVRPFACLALNFNNRGIEARMEHLNNEGNKSNKLIWFINATVAGLLIGLAYIELAPSYLPGFALDPEQYRLFEFHLALNAVLLLGAGYYLKRGGLSGGLAQRIIPVFFIYMPLWGLAFVNGILAGKVLFVLDAEKLWILLLTIPAAVNFFAAPAMLEQDKSSSSDNADDTEVKDLRSTGSTGAKNVSAAAIWWSHIYSAVYQAVFYAFFILLLGFGSMYYYVLDALLFTGETLSLEQFESAAPAVFENLLPYLIVLPLVIAAMIIIIGIISATYQAFLKSRHPSIDRQLIQKEIEYIEDSHKELTAYLESQKYPSLYGWLYYGGGFFFLLLSMGVMSGGSVLLTSFLASLHEAERTAGSIVYIYGDMDFGISGVIGVFSGIFMLWASYQAAGAFAPKFAEYAFISGWNTFDNQNRTGDIYFDGITKYVRIGALNPEENFHPSKFLLMGFRDYEKIVFGATGLLLLFNAYFLYLDSKIYHLFTDDRIEYADYFSTRNFRIDYADVKQVTLSCYTYTDDGKKEVSHSYEVIIDDDHSVNIFSDSKFTQANFNAFRAVDQKLKGAGVKFVRDDFYGWPKKNKVAYREDCRAILMTEYGSQKGSAIADLLQADEQ